MPISDLCFYRTYLDVKKSAPGFDEHPWGLNNFQNAASGLGIQLIEDETEFGYSFLTEGVFIVAYNPQLKPSIRDMVLAHEFSHVLLGHAHKVGLTEFSPTSIKSCEQEATAISMIFWLPARILTLHEQLSNAPAQLNDVRRFAKTFHGDVDENLIKQRYDFHLKTRLSRICICNFS